MSIENTKYWNDIIRYFSDSLSADKKKELFDWLATNPNYKEDFNQIKIIWEASKERQKEFSFDVEEIWKDLKQKLENQPDQKPAINNSFKINTRWLKIAAAFVILIGIGILMRNGFGEGSTTMVEIVTPADSTMSFFLSDGTHIILNENSTFSYPEVFAKNHREVKLNGEAYFDVKPNPNSPFTSYSGNSKTTVLGTSFNIRAREDDDDVEVEVFEGEVELSDIDESEGSKTHIKKHEKGSYNKSEKSTSKKKSSGKKPKWVKKIIKSKPIKHIRKEFKKAFNNVKEEL